MSLVPPPTRGAKRREGKEEKGKKLRERVVIPAILRKTTKPKTKTKTTMTIAMSQRIRFSELLADMETHVSGVGKLSLGLRLGFLTMLPKERSIDDDNDNGMSSAETKTIRKWSSVRVLITCWKKCSSRTGCGGLSLADMTLFLFALATAATLRRHHHTDASARTRTSTRVTLKGRSPSSTTTTIPFLENRYDAAERIAELTPAEIFYVCLFATKAILDLDETRQSRGMIVCSTASMACLQEILIRETATRHVLRPGPMRLAMFSLHLYLMDTSFLFGWQDSPPPPPPLPLSSLSSPELAVQATPAGKQVIPDKERPRWATPDEKIMHYLKLVLGRRLLLSDYTTLM